MVFSPKIRFSFLHLVAYVTATVGASVDGALATVERAIDPCAAIGGQKWVAPSALRACFTSVQVDPTIKQNVRFSAHLHLINPRDRPF